MARPRPLRPGPGHRLRRQGRQDHRRRLREGRALSAVVYIAEWDEEAADGERFDRYWTGRFYGHVESDRGLGEQFEGLALADAIAWARERSAKIVIRIGDEQQYVIGVEPSDEYRAWPERGVEPPRRRRLQSEAWKDRTDTDPAAPWTVRLSLAPPDVVDVREPAWDAVVEAVATELGRPWSARDFDGFLKDLRRSRRTNCANGYFMTGHAPAYRIDVPVQASTEAQALATARAQCPGLPDGWTLSASASFDG